jgi:hypothetical protein
MQPFEFNVFMCRITFEHYKGTPYKDEAMHLKFEKLLPVWLAPVHTEPLYTSGEDFAYDIKMAKKKERQRKRDLGLSTDEDEEEDYDSEDESSEEEKKNDD